MLRVILYKMKIITAILLLAGFIACGKHRDELAVVDIGSGSLSPKAVLLSSIADTVKIVRIPFPFRRDRIVMLDSGFVVERGNCCLLLDSRGDSIQTIARQGSASDEYDNCFALSERAGLVYITDRAGVTKSYTQEGRLAGSFVSPVGSLDAIGVVDDSTFAGYRVNNWGDEPERMIFYNAGTILSRLPYHKKFGTPKGWFNFRRDGQFVRTSGSLLFKELLNDTIYETLPADYNLRPAYRLELDSLRAIDSLRYTLERPETELFSHTPYVMLLGEHRSTFWVSTVYSSYEWQKQVYATHCYDRKSGLTYSLELKMSMDEMGRQSQLLYDTTGYLPPSVNWDNFFPEQMSADGRYLIAFRGVGMDRQVLVVARLKEDPMAELRPVSLVSRIGKFVPGLFLLLLIGGYCFFRYKKNEEALERIRQQLSDNEQALERYRREQEEESSSSAELEQQISRLEKKNEELRRHLDKPGLFVSDEGYNLFVKLKAEPTYVFIGEKEYAHLCRVTDNLYHGFASRLRETYTGLTKHDIETCCLLKAGLTNRELSIIFNNTPAAITKSKNRIKKRIGLEADVNLDTFLQDF